MVASVIFTADIFAEPLVAGQQLNTITHAKAQGRNGGFMIFY